MMTMILLSLKFLKQNVTRFQRASIVENPFWAKALATPSNKMTDKRYYAILRHLFYSYTVHTPKSKQYQIVLFAMSMPFLC